MWIAWAGVILFGLGCICWMLGFSELVAEPAQDDTVPTQSIQGYSLLLCAVAVASLLVSVVFLFYGLVEVMYGSR